MCERANGTRVGNSKVDRARPCHVQPVTYSPVSSVHTPHPHTTLSTCTRFMVRLSKGSPTMTAERQAREANMAIACNNSKHTQASVTHSGSMPGQASPLPYALPLGGAPSALEFLVARMPVHGCLLDTSYVMNMNNGGGTGACVGCCCTFSSELHRLAVWQRCHFEFPGGRLRVIHLEDKSRHTHQQHEPLTHTHTTHTHLLC